MASNKTNKNLILLILDGWGLGPNNESNPIYVAKPKFVRYAEDNFMAGALQASGLAVGLPWEEEGNSEVGHLTIGAGRVILQHFLKINKSIEDRSFFQNPELIKAFEHAKKFNSSIHLVGLLTKANVHASLNHVAAFLEAAKKFGLNKVFIQAFSDGRDSPPRSVLSIIDNLQAQINKIGVGKIASLTGRYFAMDRDKQWQLTEKAYKALVGEAPVKPLKSAVEETYQKGENDEYIEPTIIEPNPIQDNDVVIFFNFREDRMRQIAKSFIDKSFDKFPVKKFNNLFTLTMADYDKTLSPTGILFPTEKVFNTLGQALAENSKTQLRVAETMKWAHVTYFFNGLRDDTFENEFRVLIPSEKIAHFDEKPEMRASAITERIIAAIQGRSFDFVLANYANPDVIAHTGNYQATVETIKVIDREVSRVIKAALANDSTLIITADHGNAEVLLDLQTGEQETKHDPSLVPFYLIGKKYQKLTPYQPGRLPNIGMLSDIAPTILEIMNLPVPAAMTGSSLLNSMTK